MITRTERLCGAGRVAASPAADPARTRKTAGRGRQRMPPGARFSPPVSVAPQTAASSGEQAVDIAPVVLPVDVVIENEPGLEAEEADERRPADETPRESAVVL